MSGETAYIGVGSNLGNREEYCTRALKLITLLPHSRVTGVSSLFETEPVVDGGHPGPGWFLNGVVRMETELSPQRLLEICQEVERALGRNEEDREGPRTMDLDILTVGVLRIETPALILPHPRMHLRRFVLTPLVDLEPDWVHPLLSKTARELLAQVTDPTAVRLLDCQPEIWRNTRSGCTSSISTH